MNVTAIDIAILPPDPIRKFAIQLSQQISSGDFQLNEINILPHITLSIGFSDDLSAVSFNLEEVCKQFKPFEVEIEKIERRYLMAKKSQAVMQVHKHIMQRISLNVDPLEKDEQQLYFKEGDEEISKETIEFTRNFRFRNSNSNYIPHITIGWDEKVDTSNLKAQLPQSFIAKEISVCQLGNFNTCRKVLYRIPLTG